MCQQLLGTLRCTHESHEPLRGKDADGVFNTKAAQTYSPRESELHARSLVAAHAVSRAVASTAGGEFTTTALAGGAFTPDLGTDAETPPKVPDSTLTSMDNGSGGAHNPFQQFDRVQVYWIKERAWYCGEVKDIYPRKVTVNGTQIQTHHVRIDYKVQG